MDERFVAEFKKRKQPINLAIVYVDPDAFVANFMGWLEITALYHGVEGGRGAGAGRWRHAQIVGARAERRGGGEIRQ